MRYSLQDCIKECQITVESVDCTTTGNFEKPLRSECQERDQLLTINGLCSREKIENFLDSGCIRRWTEILVPEVLCIPDAKPDIEQLISISSTVEIISQRVISTPVKTSGHSLRPPIFNQEGTALTGSKLVVEGILRQKIVYSAVQTQRVHSVHFDVPFSAFIVLDPRDTLTRKFRVDTCIEDIYVKDITARKIFKNVTLIIRAMPLVC